MNTHPASAEQVAGVMESTRQLFSSGDLDGVFSLQGLTVRSVTCDDQTVEMVFKLHRARADFRFRYLIDPVDQDWSVEGQIEQFVSLLVEATDTAPRDVFSKQSASPLRLR